MNQLLILINSGEFLSIDKCVNFIIMNNLNIHINDFIKYIHINFFDFIDIATIYNIIILNHQCSKDFIIDAEIQDKFNIRRKIKKYIKMYHLIQNIDYIIIKKETSWAYYITHFGKSKEEYILTPFAFKYILVCLNLQYIKYILLLEICINHYMNYLDKVRNNN